MALNGCPHVSAGISFVGPRLESLLSQRLACNGCTNHQVPNLLMCLACGYIGCSSPNPSSHALNHYSEINTIVLDDDVVHVEHDDEIGDSRGNASRKRPRLNRGADVSTTYKNYENKSIAEPRPARSVSSATRSWVGTSSTAWRLAREPVLNAGQTGKAVNPAMATPSEVHTLAIELSASARVYCFACCEWVVGPASSRDARATRQGVAHARMRSPATMTREVHAGLASIQLLVSSKQGSAVMASSSASSARGHGMPGRGPTPRVPRTNTVPIDGAGDIQEIAIVIDDDEEEGVGVGAATPLHGRRKRMCKLAPAIGPSTPRCPTREAPVHSMLAAPPGTSVTGTMADKGMGTATKGLAPVSSSTAIVAVPGRTGMRNVGNTCYINAVVQALSRCEVVRTFFLYSFGLHDRPGIGMEVLVPRPSALSSVHASLPTSISYLNEMSTPKAPRQWVGQDLSQGKDTGSPVALPSTPTTLGARLSGLAGSVTTGFLSLLKGSLSTARPQPVGLSTPVLSTVPPTLWCLPLDKAYEEMSHPPVGSAGEHVGKRRSGRGAGRNVGGEGAVGAPFAQRTAPATARTSLYLYRSDGGMRERAGLDAAVQAMLRPVGRRLGPSADTAGFDSSRQRKDALALLWRRRAGVAGTGIPDADAVIEVDATPPASPALVPQTALSASLAESQWRAASLTVQVAHAIRITWSGCCPSYVPACLVGAVKARLPAFDSPLQQDAQEFAVSLLDSLQGEMRRGGREKGAEAALSTPRFPASKWVDDTFEGSMRMCVTCCTCGAQSSRVENFTVLSLDLQDRAGQAEVRTVSSAAVPSAVPGVRNPKRGRDSHPAAPSRLANVSGPETACKAGADPTLPSTDLAACLGRLCAPEKLDGETAYWCNTCSSKGKGKQIAMTETRLHALPKVLTVHLNRAQWPAYMQGADGGAGAGKGKGGISRRGKGKLHTQVDFPAELTGEVLQPFLSEVAVEAYCGNVGAGAGAGASSLLWASPPHHRFHLRGLVEHIGRGIDTGHYIAYAREGPHGWLCMDDHKVRAAEEEEVMKAPAYLLMYERE